MRDFELRRPGGYGVLFLLPLLLAACGVVARTKTLFGGRLPIEVSVAEAANENSPVACDLLILYKDKLLEDVLEKTAREWFSGGREQFLRDQPQGYDIHSWEWVPGHRETLLVSLGPGASDGIVFADYFSDGQHRMRIDPRRPIRLVLAKDAFSVEPLKE